MSSGVALEGCIILDSTFRSQVYGYIKCAGKETI